MREANQQRSGQRGQIPQPSEDIGVRRFKTDLERRQLRNDISFGVWLGAVKIALTCLTLWTVYSWFVPSAPSIVPRVERVKVIHQQQKVMP